MQVNAVCVVQGTNHVIQHNQYRFFLEFVERKDEQRYTGDLRTLYQPYWNIIGKINEVTCV